MSRSLQMISSMINSSPDSAGIKPFRLFTYFALASFVVIAASTIILSLFLFHQEKSILLRKNEDFALLLSENLNNQIFRKFVLPTTKRYGKITLRQEAQYSLLDTVVKTTLYGFKVGAVTLYSDDRLMVYSTKYDLDKMLKLSTQPEYLGIQTDPNPDLVKALEGSSKSHIISHGSLFQLYFSHDTGLKILRTMAPFYLDLDIATKTEPIMGALEIVLDITEDFRGIMKQQILTMSTAVLIMFFLFITLLMIVRRAEQILERRQQEKERLEQQLNQSERLAGLGRMVAGVSHEIRNPLGIISSTAEILAKRMHQYEPQNKLADIILEESNRMNGVVTEFLDFARPQAPKAEPCMISDVMERNLTHLTPQFEKIGIRVQRRISPDLGPISIDPDLLYRSLLNIFNNAIQAMPDGGILTVGIEKVRENGKQFQRITVSDTGDGIPEEAKKNLFSPFFTTREKGTGLGLAIVKNIVEGHGGHIEIESPVEKDSEGNLFGTLVSITLGTDSQAQASMKGKLHGNNFNR